MRYIFVDFEMNPIIDKFQQERQICKQEVIEIGAVMFDDAFNEIDSFKLYVKPQYSYKICKKCKKLTGITTDMVAMQVGFKKSFRRFIEWCGKHDYQIFAWSDNDQIQIEQEMILKKVKKDHRIAYMLQHWTDFQELFRQKVDADAVISLQKAVKACGMTFVGRPHDALDDARNTGLLYVEYQLNGLKNYVKPYKKIELAETQEIETLKETQKIAEEIHTLEVTMLPQEITTEILNFTTFDSPLA